MPYAAAGTVKEGWATLVGQGRGAFAYPDSVKDLMNTGRMDPRKTCVACSGCTQIMRDGAQTGCIIRDSEIYGPIYRAARRRAADRLKEEAKRCRDCEFANCRAGCPAGVDVPGFIKAFEAGDIKNAYTILRENNALPELCAYVCPSEVQCEQFCMEAIMKGVSVPIRDIQQYVSARARELGLTGARLPGKDNGKKIAVAGAGPAGLACAIRLLELGYLVDIYDKRENPGGTPFDIIPKFRLETGQVLGEMEKILYSSLSQKRLRLFMTKGLSAKNNLDAVLAKKYRAVFLGLGLGKSVGLGAQRIPSCVEDAVEFLKRIKTGSNTVVPERVAVLGGGNTAMDVAFSAKKAGARDVYLVYRRSFAEMPAWPKERDAVLNAGVHFLILSQPTRYVEKDGKITGVKIARCVLGEPDASGRRRPIVQKGSETVLAVDLAVEAIGQHPVEGLDKLLPGVKLDNRGFIVVDADFRTSRENVYAGGDIVNRGTTVVRAVAEGMKAAEAINRAVKE
jgi:glutamate synthase (NADPH/NADH) small chain